MRIVRYAPTVKLTVLAVLFGIISYGTPFAILSSVMRSEFTQLHQHLLLVDDEPAILMAFKKLLQNSEMSVDTAETIEYAKELLDRRAYAAVIADLRLTGFAGEEGLEIIRYVKDRHPETQIILITAYGNQDVMKKACALGAAFYFEKPVSANIIKNALKTLGVVKNALLI
jgi:DNA-binding NtrC family response regulator